MGPLQVPAAVRVLAKPRTEAQMGECDCSLPVWMVLLFRFQDVVQPPIAGPSESLAHFQVGWRLGFEVYCSLFGNLRKVHSPLDGQALQALLSDRRRKPHQHRRRTLRGLVVRTTLIWCDREATLPGLIHK